MQILINKGLIEGLFGKTYDAIENNEDVIQEAREWLICKVWGG